MVGRELTQQFPRVEHCAGEIVMEIRNWTVTNPDNPGKLLIDNINMVVKKGEILGIAGLVGAGRTEMAMSLFGALNVKSSGDLIIEEKPVKIKKPSDAIGKGLSYMTEDRKQYGLVLINSVKANMSMASLKKLRKMFMIDENKEIRQTNRYVNELKIKTRSVIQQVKNLSGGNQQKVIIAKWLLTKPRVLIMDEPTRGVDVGAKLEIYNLMNQLVDQGVCIVMISSELPEVLGMSDRIYVMHEGKISAELSYTEATQKNILYYAAGGNKDTGTDV
jgi:D-xylose transport system ATP-binding protein